jgi:hypothetical protein
MNVKRWLFGGGNKWEGRWVGGKEKVIVNMVKVHCMKYYETPLYN